jgi:hypothetical protein
LARNSPRFPPSAYSISKNIFLHILKQVFNEQRLVSKRYTKILVYEYLRLYFDVILRLSPSKKLRSSCMRLKRSSAIHLMSFCSTSWTYLKSASGLIYRDFYFFKISISEKCYYLFEVPSMSSQRKVRPEPPLCVFRSVQST